MAIEQVEVSTSVKTDPTSEATGKVLKREAVFTYDIPGTLTEAIEKYGDKAVYEEFLGGLTVTIQAPARKALTAMAAGLSKEEYSHGVQDTMNNWTLGQKAPRGRKISDPVASLADLWPTLSPERQAEIMAKFGFAPVAAPLQEVEVEEENDESPSTIEPHVMEEMAVPRTNGGGESRRGRR